MHNLLLSDAADRPIDIGALRRIFQHVPGFHAMREHTPAGTPLEAEFAAGQDFTQVRLSSVGDAISIRGTTDAALQAAWAIRLNLDAALRIFDTAYSFDLMMSSFSSLDDLERAIAEAQSNSE